MAAILIPAASVVTFASMASADPATGEFWIKGQGTVYTDHGNWVTLNAPSTFSLEVVNTGSVIAQFKVYYYDDNEGGFTDHLLAGNVDVTPLANNIDGDMPGYYTAPIAPGKAQVLTFKASVNAETDLTSFDAADFHLENLDGDPLDEVTALTNIKKTSGGTGSADLFGSAGSDAVAGFGTFEPLITAPTVAKVGQKATFSVKLYNHTHAAVSETVALFPTFHASGGLDPLPDDCDFSSTPQSFPITVKLSNTDVTGPMLTDNGFVKSLAANGSLTFTVTVTYPGPGADGCTESAWDFGAYSDGDDGGSGGISMITNGAATVG